MLNQGGNGTLVAEKLNIGTQPRPKARKRLCFFQCIEVIQDNVVFISGDFHRIHFSFSFLFSGSSPLIVFIIPQMLELSIDFLKKV